MNPSRKSVELTQRVAAQWPVSSWGPVTAIVAVSGGRDSMALLHVLAEIKSRAGEQDGAAPASGQLIVAHVNHQLRGAESQLDQQLVETVAADLGLECEISCQAPSPPEGSGSVEAVCRENRYTFLRQLAARRGARFLVTAHHEQDQIETVLFRALRGTSISGLAGMKQFRSLHHGLTLARPLLHCPRHQIEDYVQTRAIPYRDDATNVETRFTRNWIRQELMPLIESRFGPQVGRALLRLAASAQEQSGLLDRVVDDWLDAACHFSQGQPDRLAESPSNDVSGSSLPQPPQAAPVPTNEPSAPRTDPPREPIPAQSAYLDTKREKSRWEVELIKEPWSRKDEVFLRYALVRLWRRMDWPEQAMTREHWSKLAKSIAASSAKPMHLPGGVRLVITDGGAMRLVR